SWPGGLASSLIAGFILLAAYCWFFLLQAAGHLSTQAETCTPQKRALALGAVLVMLAAWLLHHTTGIDFRILGLLTPLVLWSVAEALVEVHEPNGHVFKRRLWFFFQPGWA